MQEERKEKENKDKILREQKKRLNFIRSQNSFSASVDFELYFKKWKNTYAFHCWYFQISLLQHPDCQWTSRNRRLKICCQCVRWEINAAECQDRDSIQYQVHIRPHCDFEPHWQIDWGCSSIPPKKVAESLGWKVSFLHPTLHWTSQFPRSYLPPTASMHSPQKYTGNIHSFTTVIK